jgi:hypothetical protein
MARQCGCASKDRMKKPAALSDNRFFKGTNKISFGLDQGRAQGCAGPLAREIGAKLQDSVCNQRRDAPNAGMRSGDVPKSDERRADGLKADERRAGRLKADGPKTLAMVFAVMAARSDARCAASRSLARSSINSAINASRLFSSTASASNW